MVLLWRTHLLMMPAALVPTVASISDAVTLADSRASAQVDKSESERAFSLADTDEIGSVLGLDTREKLARRQGMYAVNVDHAIDLEQQTDVMDFSDLPSIVTEANKLSVDQKQGFRCRQSHTWGVFAAVHAEMTSTTNGKAASKPRVSRHLFFFDTTSVNHNAYNVLKEIHKSYFFAL